MTLIASVQIPKLAIAVARRDHPTLADHPLILYAMKGIQAVVATASDDAGLVAGTPLRQAIIRCPHALFRPADAAYDQQVLHSLITLLQAFSPRVMAYPLTQDAQIDLDLGRIDLPHTIALTQRLARRIQTALRVTPALGVASTRFVAQHAAQHAGVGATVLIPSGREATFLARHPISTLPIDAPTLRQLHLLGLDTIGAVANLPLDALQAQFGGTARTLYQLTHGGSDHPISPNAVAATLSQRRRFAGPLTNRTLLDTAISRLTDRLATHLVSEGWAARTIALTLTLDDGEPWIAQQTLSAPTAGNTQLREAFLALSRTAILESGVTALTVQISELVPTAAVQLDLFAPAVGQAPQLKGALDRLQARYASSFVRARLADPTAQLPEQRVCIEPWERL
jgi:nucleotidyltransferase/DNA polymerase involved in DNA repair